jgi:hypothetical protein
MAHGCFNCFKCPVVHCPICIPCHLFNQGAHAVGLNQLLVSEVSLRPCLGVHMSDDKILPEQTEAQKQVDQCLREIAKHERAIKKLKKQIDNLIYEETLRLCPFKVGDVIEFHDCDYGCKEWHPVKVKSFSQQQYGIGAYFTHLTETGKAHNASRINHNFVWLSETDCWRMPQ